MNERLLSLYIPASRFSPKWKNSTKHLRHREHHCKHHLRYCILLKKKFKKKKPERFHSKSNEFSQDDGSRERKIAVSTSKLGGRVAWHGALLLSGRGEEEEEKEVSWPAAKTLFFYLYASARSTSFSFSLSLVLCFSSSRYRSPFPTAFADEISLSTNAREILASCRERRQK